ncbi:MAG: hypothetical protein ACOCYV_02310 [Planctomycetota bacterium]
MRRDTLLRLARRLLQTPTAAGLEDAMAAVVRAQCDRIGLPVHEDPWGNLLVRCERGPGSRSTPPLVFVAHLDHPAFEFLGDDRAEFLGGVPDALFAARATVVFADGARARCMQRRPKTGRRRRLVRLDRALPDTPPGTPGRWDVETFAVDGDRLVAWGIDDLLGVCAMLACLRDLAAARAPTRTWALFTRAEEIGLLGSIHAARAGILPADAQVISIETSNAVGRVAIGGGPVIRIGDRGTIFDPAITALLERCAADLRGLRWQRALMDGGTCEGSAWSAFGYRCGGLCLPLGNYHNIGPDTTPAAEYISVRDLQGLVRLCTQLGTVWLDHDPTAVQKRLRDRYERILDHAPRRLGP